MKKADAVTITYWLESISTEGRNLTKWEQDFVDSVAEQFKARGSLSSKQIEVLERIYTEKVP